jgi:hypothetical protein
MSRLDFPDSEIVSLMWDQTIQKDGCWLYTGNKRRGHGAISLHGIHYGVHQLSLSIFKGINLEYKLDGSLLTLHIRECPNKNCWNPDHLYVGTNSDNTKDMVAIGRHNEARKTHCPKGHPYDKVLRRGNGKLRRECSICRRKQVKNCMRKRRARKEV